MPTKSSACRLLTAILLGGLFVAGGCMTGRLPEGSAAYLHVTANGMITFWGEPVALSRVAEVLQKAGATHETLVKIIPQGEVSERLIRSLAGSLGRNGFRRVAILEPRKAVTVVAGKTQAEVPADAVTGTDSETTAAP